MSKTHLRPHTAPSGLEAQAGALHLGLGATQVARYELRRIDPATAGDAAGPDPAHVRRARPRDSRRVDPHARAELRARA